MTVTILVATVGRPTLERTLTSITSQTRPGDQVLVVGATTAIADRAKAAGCQFLQVPPGNDWGATERAVAIHHATGDYVASLDDDDVYLPGARDAMERVMTDHPEQPAIFKMHIARTGGTLWSDPVVRMGNVGTPMVFLPVPVAKHGTWGKKYGNDFVYLNSLQLNPKTIVWDPTVIASIKPK